MRPPGDQLAQHWANQANPIGIFSKFKWQNMRNIQVDVIQIEIIDRNIRWTTSWKWTVDDFPVGRGGNRSGKMAVDWVSHFEVSKMEYNALFHSNHLDDLEGPNKSLIIILFWIGFGWFPLGYFDDATPFESQFQTGDGAHFNIL